MKRRILVVEDEPTIALMLQADLDSEGYDVTVATTGPQGLQLATSEEFSLVLLDVMLPGKDGFEICREIRRAGTKTPIILLTARTHDAEKVMGLELGADDYITKPFNPRELRARIKAVLRRTAGDAPDVVRFGPVEVDFTRGEVRRDGAPIDVTALEFRLITAFVRSPGRLLTREHLLDTVWGRGIAISDRVIDNHIVSVRRKLEPNPSEPRHFVNVRGMGYRFDAQS
jgi:DNA-binding response OmpR family regulator